MNSNLLVRLAMDDFHDAIGPLLPAEPLRRQLQRSPDVRRLALAVRFGVVTSDEIREFVSNIMKEFKPGEYFHGNLTLAALAVAMESWSNDFAEEYLLHLARIKAAELSKCVEVARKCAQEWFARPMNDVRLVHYAAPVSNPTIRVMRARAVSEKLRNIKIEPPRKFETV